MVTKVVFFSELWYIKRLKNHILYHFGIFFFMKVLRIQKKCIPLHPQSRNIDKMSVENMLKYG